MNQSTDRIGVIVPTFQRPDFARFSLLQWAAQTRKPDLIAVHQNGSTDRYEWAAEDIADLVKIEWLYTPKRIPQHEWYVVPLQYLLDQDCTHFFWADHDDIYRRNHIEKAMLDLEGYDYSIASNCGVLYLRPDGYRYRDRVRFTSHAPGGMSSSMCFNRAFAEALVQDILQFGHEHSYTDNVVSKVTMPKFKCKVSTERETTIYVSHGGSLTSAGWVDSVFAELTPPLPTSLAAPATDRTATLQR